MTPPPISLAAAPPMSPSAGVSATPSSLPTQKAPADGKAAAFAFVEQLSKLLQTAALTTQSPLAETSGAQPGSTSAVPAQSGTPDSASAQSQVILPPLPNTASVKQPETQAVQPRNPGGSKSKAEAATPGRHPRAASDQPATLTMVALPAPDVIATPPVPPPATHDGMVQHQPGRDQHGDQSTASGGDQPGSAAVRIDGIAPGMAELTPQSPQDASTAQVAPPAPPTDTLAPAMQAALPQSQVPPGRPAETASAPTSSPAPMSHSNPPAAQITPALMQIGHGSDGTPRLTVRLDPPELGHVQIRIDRPSDASARVEITVEKQETLNLLLRDQPQLQRTLDQAGVPADGRTVTFHVADPAPSVRTDAGTAPVAGTDAGGLTGDLSHGAARHHGRPANQSHGTSDDEGAEFTSSAVRGWLRAGLDITA